MTAYREICYLILLPALESSTAEGGDPDVTGMSLINGFILGHNGATTGISTSPIG